MPRTTEMSGSGACFASRRIGFSVQTIHPSGRRSVRARAILDALATHRPALATALDRVIATTRNRSQTLDNFRGHTADDMEALNELTKILEPPTWLTSLQLTREAVTMSGETEQAAGLLKLLDNSKQFKGSDFTLPMQRMGGGETFFIRASRKGVRP